MIPVFLVFIVIVSCPGVRSMLFHERLTRSESLCPVYSAKIIMESHYGSVQVENKASISCRVKALFGCLSRSFSRGTSRKEFSGISFSLTASLKATLRVFIFLFTEPLEFFFWAISLNSKQSLRVRAKRGSSAFFPKASRKALTWFLYSSMDLISDAFRFIQRARNDLVDSVSSSSPWYTS